jgi:hypothetical protein
MGNTALGIAPYSLWISLYPGLLFLASSVPVSLDNTCFDAIDAIIHCEPAKNSPGDSPGATLWRQYFTNELSELASSISASQLSQACQKLAKAESREPRIAKTLKTAKRLAFSKNATPSLDHVMMVVRSSLSEQDAK